MMMSGSWRRKACSAVGEREPRLVVDVDLVDAGELDFRRVFGGRDVDARLVQDVEAGVERDRLAAARRAR